MKLALIALAAAAVAAPAFAQAPQMTPAMQAARQQVMQQCAADMKTYCDGKTGPDMRQCMQENATKMSDGCKSAMQAMMAARQAGG
jgi:hypothetical protein